MVPLVAENSYDLDGDEFGDLQEYGPGEECTRVLEHINDTQQAREAGFNHLAKQNLATEDIKQ